MLNLIAVEVGHSVDENPGDRSTKVDDFMHHKGHYTGSQNIVLHEGVPCCPEPFGDIEMCVVGGDLIIMAPVGDGWRREKCRVIPKDRLEPVDKKKKKKNSRSEYRSKG